MRLFLTTIVILCAITSSGCTPGKEIMVSERAQDGLWALVHKELVTTTSEDSRRLWNLRIPRIRLENQRRTAALAGEDFDMAKALEALGIKKREAVSEEVEDIVRKTREALDDN